MTRWQKGTFDHDGDGRPGGSLKANHKEEDAMTEAKKKADKPVESDPAKLKEVDSNHNSVDPAKPVQTAQVKSMPDYNPQRRASSRANAQTDVTTKDGNEVVEAKGDRPTVAETDAENAWGDKTPASEAEAEGDAAKGAS